MHEVLHVNMGAISHQWRSRVKGIAILGSTGSIGRQTLELVRAHGDVLKVAALAAGAQNVDLLVEQIATFQPELVSVPDSDTARKLKEQLSSQGAKPEIMCGDEGLLSVAEHPGADTVVVAVVGFLGVAPTAAAIRMGKTIALANKETLVAAGSVIMPMSQEHQAKIVPVD